MLKRAAENQDDGPEAKKAPGKFSSSGARAEEIKNPIPRLFKQNLVTIHITQRTFEEIGPGDLKYIPTSQYYAAMFDRFHAQQFKTYFNRCSTFEITDPKVRISNILMLQDSLESVNSTPKDVSVFTQACYLMHYQPRGIKQWFKLGSTSDCMVSQNYLKYKPFETTDCSNINQLIKVGGHNEGYVDFERLVINPAKADFYAGWAPGVTAASVDPINQDCNLIEQLEGEINISETSITANKTYYVTDTFISPRDPYLGEFSCSFKGCEAHIPMTKHTTYARNLDKINLHKYGDSFGFHINTNLEGVQMLKHDANNPYGHIFQKRTKGSRTADTNVRAVFCYPSNNRPFFSRSNNFDPNGPVDSNKSFPELTHHFLTMPPIKKNDGTLLKQRCSFIMEQSMSITFHFPETVTEDQAEDMLAQKDAVILRPAIVSLGKGKESESPKITNYFDYVRDQVREQVRSVTNLVLPPAVAGALQVRAVGTRTAIRNRLKYSLPTYAARLCEELGLTPVCSNMKEIISRGIGGRPTLIDWNNLISAPPEPVKETEMIDGIILPKATYKYELKSLPLNDNELFNMIEDTPNITQRNIPLAAYLFYDFMQYLAKNNALDFDGGDFDSELPDSAYLRTDIKLSASIVAWLQAQTDKALNEIFNYKCPSAVLRLHPDKLGKFTIWNRDSGSWTSIASASLQRPSASGAPLQFQIYDWIEYLWRMRVIVLPTEEGLLEKFVETYNRCVNHALDEELPRVPLTEEQYKYLKDKGLIETQPIQQLEPIPEVADKMFNFETNIFFV